jgi:hypothetical protein
MEIQMILRFELRGRALVMVPQAKRGTVHILSLQRAVNTLLMGKRGRGREG